MFKDYIPLKSKEEILKELEPKDIDIQVDVFEQIILNDIAQGDDNIRIKLARNLTSEFTEWVFNTIKNKEQVKINIKGATRCHLKGSLIMMADFSQKRIEDCIIGDKVFTINEKTNKIEIKEVLELWDNGKQDIYEIKLKGNHKVYATKEHKFYSIKILKKVNETHIQKDKKIIQKIPYHQIMSKPYWCKINELDLEKNYLALPFKIPFYEKTKYNLNEIELLGFWLGDGYMRNNHSKNSKQVQIDLSKQEKIDYLNFLVNNSNLNYKITKCSYKHKENPTYCDGNKFSFTKKIQNQGINNSNRYKDDFSKIIYELNLDNCLAPTKFIPNIFLNATENEIYALLSGLINSDGSIDKTKGILYHSVSFQLIEDIKIILLKLGINFQEKFKLKQKENYLECKTICISDYESCKMILDNCNLTLIHKEKLKFYLNSKNKKYIKNNYYYKQDNLIFKKIKSITKINKGQTYDLTIADNHNFISNNIISHNSGKSLIGIRVLNLINKANKEFDLIKDFSAYKVICDNQKILRQRLNLAEFGDFFLIDENAFANVGAGSFTEAQQLKDLNNIIAKKNIHMIYITPQVFLPTGATTGLAYFGRDTKNWVSRFLLYSLKSNMPSLLGYVVFDVGKNFSENGCYVYKQMGGCTNPKRLKFQDIDKDYIFHSEAIDKSKLNSETLDDSGQVCPFYNICNSFNCHYEHIKDSWIQVELQGGKLSARDSEKLEVSLQLFEEFGSFNIDKGQFRLNAKNGKELKLKIKMRLPFINNTKYTGVEIDDIIQQTISLLDMQFLEDSCKLIGKDHKEIIDKMMNRETSDDKPREKEFEEKPKTINDDIIEITKQNPKDYIDLIEYAKQLNENSQKNVNKNNNSKFDDEKEGDLNGF